MMGIITTSEQLSKTPGDQAAAFQKLIRGRVLPSGGGSTAAFNTNKGQSAHAPYEPCAHETSESAGSSVAVAGARA